MPTRRSAEKNPSPVVAFRMRITLGDTIAIGPGKIRLLEAIEETGSLTAAAKRIEMSYRRAWLLLDELNAALKRPAVESVKGGEHGGGSVVTPVGKALIGRYRDIERAAATSNAADIRFLLGLLVR